MSNEQDLPDFDVAELNRQIKTALAGARGDWKQEGYTFEIEPRDKQYPNPETDSFFVNAFDPSGKRIGRTLIIHHTDGRIFPESLTVDEPHRRKGIATEMYRLAEEVSGKKLRPEGQHLGEGQTDDAYKLWTQPNRPFATKAAASPADLGYSDEYDEEDLQDAINHLRYPGNAMAPINGDYDYPESTATKIMEPEKLLPAKAFKKPKGWLKEIPEANRAAEFAKLYKRDPETIQEILQAKAAGELKLPIVINGDLGDGFGRVLLAHGLGEKVPVEVFRARRLRSAALETEAAPEAYSFSVKPVDAEMFRAVHPKQNPTALSGGQYGTGLYLALSAEDAETFADEDSIIYRVKVRARKVLSVQENWAPSDDNREMFRAIQKHLKIKAKDWDDLNRQLVEKGFDGIRFTYPKGGGEFLGLAIRPSAVQEASCTASIPEKLRDEEQDFDDWLEQHDPISENVFPDVETARAWFRKRHAEVYGQLRDLQGAIILYRAVGFHGLEELGNFVESIKQRKYLKGFKGLGLHWSFNQRGADAYEGGPNQVVVVARVPENSIDWEGTYLRLMDPMYGEDEDEFRLKPGAPIEVLSLIRNGKEIWKPQTAHRMRAGGFYAWEDQDGPLYQKPLMQNPEENHFTWDQQSMNWPSVKLSDREHSPALGAAEPTEQDIEDAWQVVLFAYGLETPTEKDEFKARDKLARKWEAAIGKAKLKTWKMRDAAKKFQVYDHGRRIEKENVDNPIIVAVVGNEYIVIDGNHRFITKFEAGDETIDAVMVPMNWADGLTTMKSEILGTMTLSATLTELETMKKAIDWLYSSVRRPTGIKKMPDLKIVKALARFRPKKPLTLYRGIKKTKIKSPYTQEGLRSWTTNDRVAKMFAGADGSVLRMKATPEQCLVDVDLASSENALMREGFTVEDLRVLKPERFRNPEHEIIVLPGTYDVRVTPGLDWPTMAATEDGARAEARLASAEALFGKWYRAYGKEEGLAVQLGYSPDESDDIPKEEAEGWFERRYRHVKNKIDAAKYKDGVIAYRCLSVTDIWLEKAREGKIKAVGGHWTIDHELAPGLCGGHGNPIRGGQKAILEAYIPFSQFDVLDLFNPNWSYEWEEYEISPEDFVYMKRVLTSDMETVIYEYPRETKLPIYAPNVIGETVRADEQDEDAEDIDYSHLKSIQDIKPLYPEIAKVAQAQYDSWQQDAEGYDEKVGYGGICHLIVDAILPILDRAGFVCTSLSLDSEVHVLTIVQAREGVFSLDIPYSVYEQGGGYTWTKLPDVKIEPDDIMLHKIFSDPGEFAQYSEGSVQGRAVLAAKTYEKMDPAKFKYSNAQGFITEDGSFYQINDTHIDAMEEDPDLFDQPDVVSVGHDGGHNVTFPVSVWENPKAKQHRALRLLLGALDAHGFGWDSMEVGLGDYWYHATKLIKVNPKTYMKTGPKAKTAAAKTFSGLNRKKWPEKMNNRQLAIHWEDMAYGDWKDPGESPDESEIEEALDRIDHYPKNTIWTLKILNVSDIAGHHEGHDASQEYIEEYAGMRAKSEFPPIIVEPAGPGKYQTLDGQHRLFAAKKLGEKTIRAYVPDASVESVLITAAPTMKTLKKNKKPLTTEERDAVMKAGAVWHHGPNGEETPAVQKATIKGKDWYWCATHRAYQCKPTLKGAIRAYDFIKTTAGVRSSYFDKPRQMRDKGPVWTPTKTAAPARQKTNTNGSTGLRSKQNSSPTTAKNATRISSALSRHIWAWANDKLVEQIQNLPLQNDERRLVLEFIADPNDPKWSSKKVGEYPHQDGVRDRYKIQLSPDCYVALEASYVKPWQTYETDYTSGSILSIVLNDRTDKEQILIVSALEFKSAPMIWNGRTRIDKGVAVGPKTYGVETNLPDFLTKTVQIADADMLAQIQKAKTPLDIPEDFWQQNPDLIYFEDLTFYTYRLTPTLHDVILKVLLARRPLPQDIRVVLWAPKRDKQYLVKDLLQRGEKLLQSSIG